jgi:hypothetical protein
MQNIAPQAASVSQEEDEFDRPLMGEKFTQTMLFSQNPDKATALEPMPTQAAAVSPAQRPGVIQNSIRKSTGSQNVAPPVASDPSPAQAAASSQTPIQTEAHSENSIARFPQNQNEVAIEPVKQGVSVNPVSTGSVQLDVLPVAVHAALADQTSAPTRTVNKPGPAVSGKNSTPITSQPIRESGNLDAIGPGGRVMERQPFVPAANLSPTAHDLAGPHGAVGKAGEPVGVSASRASGPDSRETFATLDAVSATGRPILIHAAPQRAEAGFHDPALGWVGVRADTSGGVVHAEVVPGSADAAQALGSHLAGLNAYLAEHHMPVETLTLSAPEGEGSGLGSGQSAGQGAGQGTQQGAGQQTGQEPAQGVYSGATSGQAMHSTAVPAAAVEPLAFFGGMDRRTQSVGPGGIHISVMA